MERILIFGNTHESREAAQTMRLLWSFFRICP